MLERHFAPKQADHFFLKLFLEVSGAKDEWNLTESLFKSIIVEALRVLHGQTGASITVDILKFNMETYEAIIRVPEGGLVKLWSALTLFSSYNGARCAFRILQVSTHLLSLASSSREWVPPAELTIKT